MTKEGKPEMRKEAREYLAIIHKIDVLKVEQQVLILKSEKIELEGMNHVQLCDLHRLLEQYYSALSKL